MAKKVVLSGIQPSGSLALGNYIGAVAQWLRLRQDHDCFFMVVDLHALTIPQEPKEFRRRCLSFVAQYLALGLDPKENTLFLQSHVPEHCELNWILSCYAYMGELNRMTQFKEKSVKNNANINAGLFTYPVLMAADILLYQTHSVPVGEDQKQHLELARDLAIRFNNFHQRDIFQVPEPFIPKTGARIMSLQDPASKMSKSDENPNNYIALLDEPATILKKFNRAVTDSETEIRFDPEKKPGVSNLLTIYATLSGQTPEQATAEFAGKNYGALKKGCADRVTEVLLPFQVKYRELDNAPDYLEATLKEGARKARAVATLTLKRAREAVGLVEIPH